MIDEALLDLLACPICSGRPRVKLKDDLLICTECKRGYRIIDGIPRMLPEDALTPEEVEEGLRG